MPRIRSLNRGLSVGLLLVTALWLGGCGGSGSTGPARTDNVYVDLTEWNGKAITALDAGRPRFIVAAPPEGQPTRRGLRGPDEAADAASSGTTEIDEPAERRVMADPPTGASGSATPRTPAADAGAAAAAATSMPLPREDPSFVLDVQDEGELDVWAIPLTTASGETHVADIRNKANSIASTYPSLRNGLWIHSSDRGSKVMFGRYQGVDDESAQRDLSMIKSIKDQSGKSPFSYSFLAHVEATGQVHPYDVRSLRKKYPKVKPLYTIDVATWISVDESDESWAQARRRAESYCAQLRSQGHEAYFYHNRVARISSVTVGKFDRTAYNSTSGLTSLAVRDLIKSFPMRLNNGEPLMVPINASDPNTAMQAQVPIIVEVPDSF